MFYRRMGRSGLKLSAISLGAWVTFGNQIDQQTAGQLLRSAFDHGVNYFDNADVYAAGQAETVMGQAIRGMQRTSLVISSKVYWESMPGPNGRGLSRKHIFESCHASLKRLGTDYLDLYFCHRFDRETPLEETVRAMDDLIHQGKVLYWGTSEWRAWQLAEAYGLARQAGLTPPAVEQPQYSMLVRQVVEDELVTAADDLGFGMVSWSPLRYGLLSGKYNRGTPKGTRLSLKGYQWMREVVNEADLVKMRQLEELAGEMGVSQAQLAIAWLLRLPELSSVITGATKLAQLEENLGALEVVSQLTPEILERIEGIMQNKPERPS